jgi:hypothetical protein
MRWVLFAMALVGGCGEKEPTEAEWVQIRKDVAKELQQQLDSAGPVQGMRLTITTAEDDAKTLVIGTPNCTERELERIVSQAHLRERFDRLHFWRVQCADNPKRQITDLYKR